MKSASIHSGMQEACLSGDVDKVRAYIRSSCLPGYEYYWTYGVGGPGEKHHHRVSFVRDQLQKNVSTWDIGLAIACEKGHHALMDFLIKNGASDWNAGLAGACKGGQMEIVHSMVNRGA